MSRKWCGQRSCLYQLRPKCPKRMRRMFLQQRIKHFKEVIREEVIQQVKDDNETLMGMIASAMLRWVLTTPLTHTP